VIIPDQTLKSLIGPTGRATSDIAESTGAVLVDIEEFSARTSEGLIQKGTLVKVRETYGLMPLVEKA